jgi:transcriptional regulator with XRE-family HTH domain
LDQSEPEIRYWPALIRFLGYDPHPAPATIGEWIASERRRAGLARRRLAELVGWDPTTIERYEADRVLLPLARRRVLETFFRVAPGRFKTGSFTHGGQEIEPRGPTAR